MKIRFWGVRGSFPVSSPDVIRYGGNTPCVEVETEDGIIVIDAGTGIRGLGKSLLDRSIKRFDMLLSHAHWDHIQGFPHCEALYEEDVSVTVHGLRNPRHSLTQVFAGQQQEPFYPVSLEQLAADINFTEHEDGESFDVAGARVTCRRLNHPGVAGGFRIECGDRAFAYICDTDLNGQHLLASDLPEASDTGPQAWLERLRQSACDLGHGVDLAVCDTFFLPEEYDPTWGHSRAEDFLDLAAEIGMRSIVLYHHRPNRTDADLDAMVARCQSNVASCQSKANGLQVLGAHEGLQIDL